MEKINWLLFDALSPLGKREVDLPKEYIICESCGHASMPYNWIDRKCPNCGKVKHHKIMQQKVLDGNN